MLTHPTLPRSVRAMCLPPAVLAFAKLEHAIDPEALDLLGREALQKLTTFTPQALSNTM